MAANEQQKAVELPEQLRGQFVALEQRLWQVETLVGVCLALAALLLSAGNSAHEMEL